MYRRLALTQSALLLVLVIWDTLAMEKYAVVRASIYTLYLCYCNNNSYNMATWLHCVTHLLLNSEIVKYAP